MIMRAMTRAGFDIIGLVAGIVAIAVPVQAQSTVKAKLVHCGSDTCLRLSGRRSSLTTAVRIAGHDFTIADGHSRGGHSWRVTVPLAIARQWGISTGNAMTIALIGSRNAVENVTDLVLPPGALGRRVELASLVVRAR